MKAQTAMLALTAVNALMFATILVRPQLVQADIKPGVLRGTGMQIIDERGKVRASISLQPADPNVVMPDGSKGYPASILFRLIDSNGRPSVKITATDEGAGFSLTEARGNAYANMIVRKGAPVMKLVDGQGHEKVLSSPQ
ncbi:MAG TPA: hypothetical protein VFN88_01675 [Caulobacteraceae bacterium]|nr:hypothetical protein [Caulobacteraceae bacterium]